MRKSRPPEAGKTRLLITKSEPKNRIWPTTNKRKPDPLSLDYITRDLKLGMWVGPGHKNAAAITRNGKLRIYDYGISDEMFFRKYINSNRVANAVPATKLTDPKEPSRIVTILVC